MTAKLSVWVSLTNFEWGWETQMENVATVTLFPVRLTGTYKHTRKCPQHTFKDFLFRHENIGTRTHKFNHMWPMWLIPMTQTQCCFFLQVLWWLSLRIFFAGGALRLFGHIFTTRSLLFIPNKLLLLLLENETHQFLFTRGLFPGKTHSTYWSKTTQTLW